MDRSTFFKPVEDYRPICYNVKHQKGFRKKYCDFTKSKWSYQHTYKRLI